MRSRVVGSGTKASFLSQTEASPYPVSVPASIDCQWADQTVTVSATTPLAELQAVLLKNGQTLPLPDPGEHGLLAAGFPGTVGGLIAMNLPHGLSAQHGGPRNWLLQVDLLFRGQPAKSGAKVVKSVAGYDVHKLFVGSRGRLGPILSATFRTWPIVAVETPTATQLREPDTSRMWIARTLPSLFDPYFEQASGVLAIDRPSCTLWADMRPARPSEGWLVGPDGEQWSSTSDPILEQRLLEAFDPEGRWE